MKNPGAYNPFSQDPKVHQMLLQALADLNYPKSEWGKMSHDEMQRIVDSQIRYQSNTKVDEQSAPATETKNETASYQGDPQHMAAFSLNLTALEQFDYEKLESQDAQGETPLHLVVMMAFQDFEKAENIILFLKKKGIETNFRNNDNLTALEIAKRRMQTTPAYARIVAALEK